MNKPDDIQRRAALQKRHGDLKTRRSRFDEYWKDIANFVAPLFARFFQSEAGGGQKKFGHIINNTGGFAVNTLASGIMEGTTSPARPWFGLTPENTGLQKSDQVKSYLAAVVLVALLYLGKSNIYKTLHELYRQLVVFGTGVMILDEDKDDLFRAYLVPVGEYCLAANAKGEVDTLYRETTMTVGQLVDRFGEENLSEPLRIDYRENRLDKPVEVVRVIEPRLKRDASKLDPKNMPWSSIWYEKVGGPTAGLLEESGYRENPILAPRWDVLANDVYGTSPGMEALGDVKALQRYELDGAMASEKLVDPPMGGPGEMSNTRVSFLPGRFTAYDGKAQKMEALQTVMPGALEAIERQEERIEQRIKTALFADLWLMLSQQEAGQPITAREVVERHEEKMLQLGPVMNRLQTELLKPLINRVLAILARAGKLPPKPQQMKNQEVGVEYLSILAQAAKAIAAGTIRDAAGFVGSLAAFDPSVLDTVKLDVMLRRYCEAVGLSPDMLRGDDEVAQLRAARKQQQAAAAQQQQALAVSQTAKNLGQANTGGDTALARAMGPVATAEAGGVVQ